MCNDLGVGCLGVKWRMKPGVRTAAPTLNQVHQEQPRAAACCRIMEICMYLPCSVRSGARMHRHVL